MKVLVTGAYGNQGKVLVPKLVKAGAYVRATDVVSDAEEKLFEMGANEVVIGELRRDEIIDKVVEGMDTVYLLLPNALSNVVSMAERIIDASIKAGVKHIVFSSCLNVVPGLLQHHEKYLIESYLMGSVINYTILKPCQYMELHLPYFPGSAYDTGVLRLPMKPEQPMSFISIDDITTAACQVIMEGEPHYFASYDLCSAGHYSYKDAAKIIGELIGKEVSVELVTLPELPTVFANDMMGVGITYHGNHPFRGNPFAFKHLTGKDAMTLPEFIKRQYQISKS